MEFREASSTTWLGFRPGPDAREPWRGRGGMEQTLPIRLWLLRRGLTRRQADIAVLTACELTNREIGAQLSIEERTVKGHLTRIFDRLGVQSRTELLLLVAHSGTGTPE